MAARSLLKSLAFVAALAASVAVSAADRSSGGPVLSPDGRWVAEITNAGADADPDSGPASVLTLRPAAGGTARMLLQGQAQAGQDTKRALHSFENPVWSLDSGYIYVDAGAWATSSAVHQVNVRTGAERFVIDGGVQGVIRTGPYRGMLLVGRHKYHPAPQLGSYDPVDVVRPDGKVILTVPGSETDEGDSSVANWLKAHGWSAN